MLPCAIRRRSASGVWSISSTWSAARTTASGIFSCCSIPVIACDDVVHRLEVLDVDGRDHVDAGVEQLLDVLPALLVPGSRERSCARARRRARPRACARQRSRRCPSPRTRCPGTRCGAAARPRGRRSAPACSRRPWVSTNADHDVGAARPTPPAFVEHRERLADAGSSSEVDPELPACHRVSLRSCRLIERHVELEHVDRRLTEEAERSTVGVVVDEPVDLGERNPRTRATRCAWMRAFATEMCGSRPEADAVTASTGTSASRPSRFSLR